ncbi:Dcp1p-Dcp2p decapping enzyme complex alpha subunit [Mortierella alpina]|uniref:mRNA guanylyltransferase n=1 Tax=Mortierella alpina TaxID=64518 RepID=A0A9P6J133_MORAP|nr:Dcp1p-Dcp2p decapping enzyme complex alpha subunit [Mortierella alpina]
MPFEFGIPIDPGFKKILQSRVRTLLQAKTEGFPGSYPVQFESSHLQLLTNEEYFVTEKVAGVRYMLLSTHTPKGPACFLIDRHYEITFVPQLLLPMRDNPAKYQNETLLDGEMVLDQDGAKKTLRFLVFDLMVLNGTVVTQRSYSTRLGMMDQDILGVQASKPSDVISKEPFTIERKTMQRSYGLNIILSGSKKHKHGGEGLIFVPVKQPYVPGTSPKLLKWKSHTTAQFQIKVTQSKERKPLYCIHVKHGTGSRFYDYVTPEPALALEWHTASPDGKIAEFWWDAQWPTQMFEKGYGLETRTGGWRFFRVREDKKDVDEETTVQALVKGLEAPVTKAQLESSIDQIRSQWKAREAGVSSNESSTSLPQSSSHSAQRPPVRPLTINSTTTRKDRERKSSMDEHGSSSPHTSTFSHPLPPKPSFQPRKSSMDQAQTHSSTPGNLDDITASTEADQNSTPLPSSSGAAPLQKNEAKASTPPPISSAPPGSSTTTVSVPTVTSASSLTSTSPTSAATSSSTTSQSAVKNPLKLPQVQAHLQPIKPWMTTAPVPRAPSVEKAGKTGKLERRGRKRALALSSVGGDPSDDTIAQRRKLSEVLHSPKAEPGMAENDVPASNLQSSKPQVGSPLAIGDRERPASKPLPLSPLNSPDFRAVNGAERPMDTHPRAAGASTPSQANDRSNEAASRDNVMYEPKQEEPDPKLPFSGSEHTRQDVEMEVATQQAVKCEPTWNGQDKEINTLMPSSSTATVVCEQARSEMAAGGAGSTLPAIALSTTEQMAYAPPSNQEKILAMAKARAVAASKLNHQRQEQAVKEKKLREDTEKFRERSRIRKEKAQERKTQEVNEAPQVQDRRAQPVRQINQQQGRQSNQETSGVRGQNQGVQRTASPQDQQRIPYSTRQSRAGSRLDAQLSAQNSPKGQARAMQNSASQKGQDSPLGEPTTRLQVMGGDAFPNRSEPTSPSELRSEQPTTGPSDQRKLHPGDAPRHHRRISSMDHSFAHVQSPKQTGSAPAAANQRDMAEMEYGQPFIKRLDVGQLGESSHRRSHSDVGVAYKPVVTAIVQPQPVARDHLPTDMAGESPQHNPIMTRIADDGRQGIHPSQSPHNQTPQRYSTNGSEVSGNSRPSSRTGEVTRATRESKARLQFILNDDPPSPEGHQEDDLPEHRPSSDGPAWNPHNTENEATPRGGAASLPSAGYIRQHYPSEYGPVDYQEAQMPSKTTAGSESPLKGQCSGATKARISGGSMAITSTTPFAARDAGSSAADCEPFAEWQQENAGT